MTDNLPLFAVLCLAIFAGGFLTGVGMYAWWHTPEWWELPDESQDVGA